MDEVWGVPRQPCLGLAGQWCHQRWAVVGTCPRGYVPVGQCYIACRFRVDWGWLWNMWWASKSVKDLLKRHCSLIAADLLSPPGRLLGQSGAGARRCEAPGSNKAPSTGNNRFGFFNLIMVRTYGASAGKVCGSALRPIACTSC